MKILNKYYIWIVLSILGLEIALLFYEYITIAMLLERLNA